MIENAQAIKFSNTVVRPYADLSSQLYYAAKVLVNAWNAQQVGANVSNDSTVVDDGAAIDGRPLITGAQLTNVVSQAEALIASYEANSSAVLDVFAGVAVNP